MTGSLRVARMMQAGLLLLAVPVVAQVKFGETSTNLNGTISSGYSATYGNLTPSTHGWTIGGDGTFSGSYHSPNFLSFTVSPYLNQSQCQLRFPVHLQCQRSQCHRQHLQWQQISRVSDLFQGLQQRRELRCSRARRLRDPWQQRFVWHQLEREPSRCTQFFGGFPDGQQLVFRIRT